MFTGLHTTQEGTASGFNSRTGQNITADWKYDSLHRYIFSLEYVYNNLTLSGEYEIDDYTMRATYSDPALAPFVSKQSPGSWFLMASYRFNDWFEMGSFYHEVYADRHHKDGSNYADYGFSEKYFMEWKDLALTLRFDPLPNTVVKFEGHKIQGAFEVIQDVAEAKKDWYLFATKVSFNF